MSESKIPLASEVGRMFHPVSEDDKPRYGYYMTDNGAWKKRPSIDVSSHGFKKGDKIDVDGKKGTVHGIHPSGYGYHHLHVKFDDGSESDRIGDVSSNKKVESVEEAWPNGSKVFHPSYGEGTVVDRATDLPKPIYMIKDKSGKVHKIDLMIGKDGWKRKSESLPLAVEVGGMMKNESVDEFNVSAEEAKLKLRDEYRKMREPLFTEKDPEKRKQIIKSAAEFRNNNKWAFRYPRAQKWGRGENESVDEKIDTNDPWYKSGVKYHKEKQDQGHEPGADECPYIEGSREHNHWMAGRKSAGYGNESVSEESVRNMSDHNFKVGDQVKEKKWMGQHKQGAVHTVYGVNGNKVLYGPNKKDALWDEHTNVVHHKTESLASQLREAMMESKDSFMVMRRHGLTKHDTPHTPEKITYRDNVGNPYYWNDKEKQMTHMWKKDHHLPRSGYADVSILK